MFRKADRKALVMILDRQSEQNIKDFGDFTELLRRLKDIGDSQGKLYSAINDLCKLVNTSNQVLADRLEAIEKRLCSPLGVELSPGNLELWRSMKVQLEVLLNRKKRGKK